MIEVLGVIILVAAKGGALASPYVIPLAALLVSTGALLWSVLSMRRQSKVDLTTQLYSRIDALEGELAIVEKHAEKLRDECAELHKQVRQLREENLDLMRKLLALNIHGDENAR